VIVTAPFIVVLSAARHHVTFGETGQLNYAWHVYPTRRAVPNEHWQGVPEGFGTPLHPTRHVFTNPDVFEFDGPVRGTYPPWTDPGYWNEGMQLRFNAAAEQRVIGTNLRFYAGTILPALIALCLVVSVVGAFRASMSTAVREYWTLILPAAVGLTSYLITTDLVVSNIVTQPSTRFFAPFIVLCLVALLAGVHIRATARAAAGVVSTAVLAAVIVALTVSASQAIAAAKAEPPVALMIAERLHEAGIQPGDRVAILGRKYDRDHDHEFWARLARVRIVSQVPNDYQVLHTSAERWNVVRALLAAAGAKAIIYKPLDGVGPPGWIPLTLGYYQQPLVPALAGE